MVVAGRGGGGGVETLECFMKLVTAVLSFVIVNPCPAWNFNPSRVRHRVQININKNLCEMSFLMNNAKIIRVVYL